MTRETTRIRESIRNRPLVREQKPMRGRELIGYLTLSALIALPAVFGLWQQTVYVRTRFQIETLRKEKLALQERYRCLTIERASLESLGRIASLARQIGLVPREEIGGPLIVSPQEARPAARIARAEQGTKPASSAGNIAFEPGASQPSLLGAGLGAPTIPAGRLGTLFVKGDRDKEIRR